MCGIFTIIGTQANSIPESRVQAMLASLAMRGPDDRGVQKFPNVLLGHTRLSIVGLADGHQPMNDNASRNSIVFNGEIYGYQELRTTLESKGHTFKTRSDTEVILKSYAEYGHACVEHLDGMFAFAIWDKQKQELFVARDRFGKKPFYYAWHDGTFFAASEIKAIFESGLIRGKVDPEAVDNYLQLMYIPPWKTIYSNIHTLPPAHAGVVREGKLTTWNYWQLQKKPLDISYDDAKKEIRRLFDTAVKKRMVADVEIGSLLSGGVDSTLVTAYAQKYTDRPIKTFSVGYGTHINELPFTKQASEKIGTDHHVLNADSNLIVELGKVISVMDEPHADSSDIAQHLISQFASTKVKVALSGDGADELFLGYGWNWKYWNTTKIVRLKNVLFSNRFKEHIKNVEVFSNKDRRDLWKDSACLDTKFDKNIPRDINLFDLTVYLPGQLLTKVDRTSMMHSLEIRSPFLDYKLAEFVYNIPEQYKTDRHSGKIILKDILTELMPKEFVYRRKQGFGAPIKEWLRTEPVKSSVEKTFANSPDLSRFFNREKIEDLLDCFYVKKDDTLQYKVWTLFCLALWFSYHQKYHA